MTPPPTRSLKKRSYRCICQLQERIASAIMRCLKNRGYNFLWLPSQNGWSLLCLQPHNHTFVFSVISSFTGAKSVPWWLPSQNGWFADLPQAHHQ